MAGGTERCLTKLLVPPLVAVEREDLVQLPPLANSKPQVLEQRVGLDRPPLGPLMPQVVSLEQHRTNQVGSSDRARSVSPSLRPLAVALASVAPRAARPTAYLATPALEEVVSSPSSSRAMPSVPPNPPPLAPSGPTPAAVVGCLVLRQMPPQTLLGARLGVSSGHQVLPPHNNNNQGQRLNLTHQQEVTPW